MTSPQVEYRVKSASEEAIRAHLLRCSDAFVPPLHDKVDIATYARKIFECSITFEAWVGPSLVGLVAAYLNDTAGRSGFITSVSVDRQFLGRGIARQMVGRCIARARELGYGNIRLEVSPKNDRALGLYEDAGFVEYERRADAVMMILKVEPEKNGNTHA